jgi:tetratricopeptide (TPR) repeat protein
MDDPGIVENGQEEHEESTEATEDVSVEDRNTTGEDSFAAVPQEASKKTLKGKLEGSISLSAWSSNAPYLHELKQAKGNEYARYLELKKEYASTPSFFVDVADFFIGLGEKNMALRILSNLAELELENHEILRVLAHRLEQLGYYKLAIAIYEQVATIRQEEPQTYRDLGLVYALDGQYQKAIDNLYKVILDDWDGRFQNIEVIAACEMNAIIAKSNKKLDLSTIDERLIKTMPVDVRIVLNWDADNSDMDLWVTDPRGEKCMYSHNRTEIGGYITNDFTQGYGPEEFFLKKAWPGKYQIEVNYYGSSQQRIAGPITIYAELYTSYGTKDEKREVITVRLKENKEVLQLGMLLFETK